MISRTWTCRLDLEFIFSVVGHEGCLQFLSFDFVMNFLVYHLTIPPIISVGEVPWMSIKSRGWLLLVLYTVCRLFVSFSAIPPCWDFLHLCFIATNRFLAGWLVLVLLPFPRWVFQAWTFFSLWSLSHSQPITSSSTSLEKQIRHKIALSWGNTG